ncbi:hypothetical protein ABK040_007514 [Willaertia magna]
MQSYYKSLIYSPIFQRFKFRTRAWIWKQGGVKKATEQIIKQFIPHLEDLSKKCGRDLIYPWFSTISHSVSLGGFSTNNKVKEVYFKGSDYFSSLWTHIDQAKTRVFIDCYTISTDQTGDKTLVKLIEAANRGVDVILCVDAFGSYHIDFSKEDLIVELKKAGGKVVKFNQQWMILYNFFFRHPSRSTIIRNHKKVCVIDDKIGLIGGMNIEDRYSNVFDRETYTEEQIEKEIISEEIERGVLDVPVDENLLDELDEELEKSRSNASDFNALLSGVGRMRDLHCLIDGPCVSYLTLSLLFSLEQSRSRFGEQLVKDFFKNNNIENTFEDFERGIEDDDPTIDNCYTQVLFSDPKKNRMHLYKNICTVIKNARSHCFISTPYFYPPDELKEALINAKKNGCDVRLLTCGRSDVPAMRYISTYIYGDYLKHGIKVYEYFGQTLHAKFMTIDGFFTSLGSYNLDKISLLTNLEVGVQHYDTKLASLMEEDFIRELEVSKEITMRTWEERSTRLKVMGFLWFWTHELFGPEGRITIRRPFWRASDHEQPDRNK